MKFRGYPKDLSSKDIEYTFIKLVATSQSIDLVLKDDKHVRILFSDINGFKILDE
jgi:hypothetical protein